MKQKFRLFILLALIIPISFMFVACDSQVSSVYKSAVKNGLKDTSTNSMIDELKATNGIDGKDGVDGDSIDLYEIYNQIKEQDGYSGSYSDFVKEYFSVQNNVYATNKAMRSVVSVYCGFTQNIPYTTNQNEVKNFESKYYGAGAGVIFRLNKEDGDAYIITNYHVVFDSKADSSISSDINVLLYGKERYSINIVDSLTLSSFWTTSEYYHKEFFSNYAIPAKYIGGSLEYDIAVLKVTNNNILKNSDALEASVFDSDEICVGETAYTIGNPSALGIATTKGIVSVCSETIAMMGADESTQCKFRVIRTDAPINSGNSGGGLFNANGELIGIVNAKIVSSTIENIGYAIPSNVACNLAKNIIKNCDGETSVTPKRCMIGLTVYSQDTTAVYNQATKKYDIIETIVVDSTTEGYDAYQKLDAGDIITSIDIYYANNQTHISKKVTRLHQIPDLSLTLSVGDVVTLHRTDATGTIKENVVITITKTQ